MLFKIPHLLDSILHFGESEHQHLHTKEIRVLVWNIFKGQKGQAWYHDLKMLAQNNDFILLQEAVFPDHQRIFEKEFLGFTWSFATSFEFGFSGKRTGIAMGSRFQHFHHNWHRHHQGEFLVGPPKVTLHHQYRSLDDLTFSLVNSHSVNFTLNSHYSRQWQSLENLIGHESGPLVVAGDFNTWNARRWNFLVDFMAEHSLQPMQLDRDPRVLKLDHVFFRNCELIKAKIRDDIRSSDHWPLEVVLRIHD